MQKCSRCILQSQLNRPDIRGGKNSFVNIVIAKTILNIYSCILNELHFFSYRHLKSTRIPFKNLNVNIILIKIN